jgi:hypothetical protein
LRPVGIYLAWSWYAKGEGRVPDALAQRWPGVYRAVENKYFVDEAYDKVSSRDWRSAAATCSGRSTPRSWT